MSSRFSCTFTCHPVTLSADLHTTTIPQEPSFDLLIDQGTPPAQSASPQAAGPIILSLRMACALAPPATAPPRKKRKRASAGDSQSHGQDESPPSDVPLTQDMAPIESSDYGRLSSGQMQTSALISLILTFLRENSELLNIGAMQPANSHACRMLPQSAQKTVQHLGQDHLSFLLFPADVDLGRPDPSHGAPAQPPAATPADDAPAPTSPQGRTARTAQATVHGFSTSGAHVGVTKHVKLSLLFLNTDDRSDSPRQPITKALLASSHPKVDRAAQDVTARALVALVRDKSGGLLASTALRGGLNAAYMQRAVQAAAGIAEIASIMSQCQPLLPHSSLLSGGASYSAHFLRDRPQLARALTQLDRLHFAPADFTGGKVRVHMFQRIIEDEENEDHESQLLVEHQAGGGAEMSVMDDSVDHSAHETLALDDEVPQADEELPEGDNLDREENASSDSVLVPSSSPDVAHSSDGSCLGSQRSFSRTCSGGSSGSSTSPDIEQAEHHILLDLQSDDEI